MLTSRFSRALLLSKHNGSARACRKFVLVSDKVRRAIRVYNHLICLFGLVEIELPL